MNSQYKAEIKTALLIRRFETRLLELFSEGKINGTVHTCVGEELIPVMLCRHTKPDDFFLSNHRGHGHFIAKTGKVYELMAEMMGKTTGISHGYGGSQHLYTDNFISNGVQGGMTPVAAGIALGMKLIDSDTIAVCFIGDGTLGEGVVYESFNLAGIWKLPVLYVLENNHYAQSSSMKQTFSGSVEERVKGFGLDYYETNVWDLDSMDAVFKAAVENTRRGNPSLVEIDCYRLNSHSKGDDNRNKNEIEEYRQRDLLGRFSEEYAKEDAEYQAEAEKTVEDSIEKASGDKPLETIPEQPFIINEECGYHEITRGESIRGNESIYLAIKKYFSEHQRAVMLGEDIENQSSFTGAPYGGAFKVTRDLSDLFPERVKNTPISEAAITGAGIGLSLMGITAIVEIMFGDFTTLTMDQILQHASKFPVMYGRQVNLPFVLRTPMGGHRGYGPTHSQSIEKLFFGMPNLDVIAVNNAVSPGEIYTTLLSAVQRPAMVIENKVGYARERFKTAKGFILSRTGEKMPTIRYSADSEITDITVFCYGGMLEIVKNVTEILAYQDILCEVICPVQLIPLNIFPVIESVKKSQKILIVEEGSSFLRSWIGDIFLSSGKEHTIEVGFENR